MNVFSIVSGPVQYIFLKERKKERKAISVPSGFFCYFFLFWAFLERLKQLWSPGRSHFTSIAELISL